MADRPAPAPMNLPNILSVSESCIPAIIKDPTESAVTGGLDNAHINEEDVVNKEDEAESESGIYSD